MMKGVRNMGKDLKGKEIGEGITQKPNGKYVARYRSLSGKRPEKVFEKLNEAKLWIADQKYQERHGEIANTNDVIVDAWFDYWDKHIKGNTIRPSTRKSYISRYEQDIKPVIGDRLLTDIKPIHCQEVLTKAHERVTSGSVEISKRVMVQLFNAAVENGLIASSPMTSTVKIKRDERTERRVLTMTEQHKFSAYVGETDHDFAFVYLFDLETGLRVSELAGLKWDDVDLQNRHIEINHQSYWYNGEFIDALPKSKAGYRTIPLTETAYQILKDIKAKKVEGIEYHEYVFKNPDNGHPLDVSRLNRRLKTICKHIGIPKISMHTLRHSFATRCIECGMRPKTLQKILGHSSINMTMDLYVHATDEAVSNEMKKLETMGGLWAV